MGWALQDNSLLKKLRVRSPYLGNIFDLSKTISKVDCFPTQTRELHLAAEGRGGEKTASCSIQALVAFSRDPAFSDGVQEDHQAVGGQLS